LDAASADVVVALPGHPSIPDFAVDDEAARGVRLYMLHPEDRYKALLLDHASESDLNRELAAHYADGFQVRLKRVFESEGSRLMAKSAGWGWLGYHAWLAAVALEGFVPRPLRLRDGILYSEYVDSQPGQVVRPTPEACGACIARRASTLRLREDPAFDSPGYRWCGWDDLVATLSRIYGPHLGPLKKHAIRRRLQEYVAPNPTLVDGRIKAADWVRCGRTLLKTDFEHHNFGGGEPDIVDPAWDLASAIFEFQLAPDAERKMVDAYVAETADTDIADRLLLYKILYAMSALRAAKYWLARKPDGERREDWNRQFVSTRSFAAFHVARYCGRNLGAQPAAWEPHLCFLDLDGVLDWGLLGFPHTTPSGVRALRLLQRNAFSVVINTARSLAHVREYCRAYRLPGGVAELGSVFWDAVRDWEVPLIDAEAAAQIESLRAEIQNLAGVFIDPENRYSIRAYRFQNGFMQPLQTAEAAALLERTFCDRLTFVQSQADTYIVQKGAGKGPALASVKAYLGCASESVAAIGDSAPDVEMLRAADIAYAPANASREVRDLVAGGECRLTSRPLQAGLLEAAMELCHGMGIVAEDDTQPLTLIDELLQVPDRHPVKRVLSALFWWRL
jgi:hydroxymethylpyrimidine pyrophosphatase-like HAD family hydrolase